GGSKEAANPAGPAEHNSSPHLRSLPSASLLLALAAMAASPSLAVEDLSAGLRNLHLRSLPSASLLLALAAMAASPSLAVEDLSAGLRNFAHQSQTVEAAGQPCNPSGNERGWDQQGCPPGQYCKLSGIGECPDPDIEQEGVCTAVSHRCNRMYRLVCACDGNEYSNPCTAYGLNVRQSGECTAEDEDIKTSSSDVE
ncbi:hypothetical protein ACHAXT_005398, partial [Thalassiosira profunda]